MTTLSKKIISTTTKSSPKPKRKTKSSAAWVAAHDARKRAAGQKRVHIWVAKEHEATLRWYAQALAASKHGAPCGLVKAAAWTPVETLDNLSRYTSGTIYPEPGPLIGMVPLYTLEALAALMRGAVTK
jgi:hypothetical protein